MSLEHDPRYSEILECAREAVAAGEGFPAVARFCSRFTGSRIELYRLATAAHRQALRDHVTPEPEYTAPQPAEVVLPDRPRRPVVVTGGLFDTEQP